MAAAQAGVLGRELEEQLHAQRHTPTFQEREIWWCSVGVNIGHEMDGKNQFYNRPVLIVRKFNPHIFFGVPLTTKIKQNPYYLPIRFKDRAQCVMLSQLRLWDGKRLTHKMGQLPDDQFEAVKQALRRLLK